MKTLLLISFLMGAAVAEAKVICPLEKMNSENPTLRRAQRVTSKKTVDEHKSSTKVLTSKTNIEKN